MITPAWVLLLPSISGTERRRDFLPPNPALLLPCNSLLAPTTVSRAGQITARKTNQPDPEAGSRRVRASEILLTQDAYEIEPGWACRVEPGSDVGDVLPRTGAASFLSVSPHVATPVADRGPAKLPKRLSQCCGSNGGRGRPAYPLSRCAAWPKRRLVPPSPRTAAPASWAIDRRSRISRPRICRHLDGSGWFLGFERTFCHGELQIPFEDQVRCARPVGSAPYSKVHIQPTLLR